MHPKTSQNGFTEFEFLGLVAAGLLIAGLLAHFIFDQSIQVERLNALVHRDGVRLNLETRFLNPEVLKKSARALPDTPENMVLKACILGDEGNQLCKKKASCCESRTRRSMPILDLGDEVRVIGGTAEKPACLNENGETVTGSKCFASSRVALEPLCAQGSETCRQATAILIRYQLQFLPEFLKDQPELSTLERTISVLVNQNLSPAARP